MKFCCKRLCKSLVKFMTNKTFCSHIVKKSLKSVGELFYRFNMSSVNMHIEKVLEGN